jgi:dihydrodipicolinate synthase/N-acetylneuraminate lyase
MLDLFDAMFCESNPIPLKTAKNMVGMMSTDRCAFLLFRSAEQRKNGLQKF